MQYYFDVYDGNREVRDDVGMDLASIADAKREVLSVLSSLCQTETEDEIPRLIRVVLREESGSTLYEGVVVLKIGRPSG